MPSPDPQPPETADLFSVHIVLPFPAYPVSRIMQYIAFGVWLLPLSRVHVTFIHAVRATFIHAVRVAGVHSLLLTGGVPLWGCTLIRWQAFEVVPRFGSYEESRRSTHS